jgi:GGDEF domain-containing protein
VAVNDNGYPTADAMLKDADAAMYRAKRRSREDRFDAAAFVAVVGDPTGGPYRIGRHS